MRHYHLTSKFATHACARHLREEKLDSKINSSFLNNARQLTKIHMDTRNKPFEYKNDIVLLIFDYKMGKYILS